MNQEEHKKYGIVNKKMQGDNLVVSIISFIVMICVVLPIWLTILLPLTMVYASLNFFFGDKKQAPLLEITTPAKDIVPSKDRKYQLIMYGATGFTGRLCSIYLTKNYPQLKWAIAGRSQSKLQKIKDELTGIDPSLEKNLDIVIADSFNVEQLKKMVNSTKTVISTVGPFTEYGNYLVALCAQYGTNYCDITGEFDWVKVMIEKYDKLAVQTGARIISCCGYDCIPYDLSVLNMAQQMQQQHKSKLNSVSIYIEQFAMMSGGTFASINKIVKNPPAYKSQLGFDALFKVNGEDQKSKSAFKMALTIICDYSQRYKKYAGLSPLGAANAAIVSRSNALLNYGDNLIYKEGLLFPNIFMLINQLLGLLVILAFVFITPLQKTIGKYIFPAPGEGPSQAQLDQGYAVITTEGESIDGQKLTSVFTLPNDPGYIDTARMLVESGLSLSLNEDEIKAKGGFWTSASCQGDVLIKRLKQSGSHLDMITN